MKDPAADFVSLLGGPDRRGAVPLERGHHAAGILPDPRWDGPRHAVVPAQDYRPRGWLRPYVVAVVGTLAGVALLVAALVVTS